MVLNSGNRNNVDQLPLDQGYFTAFGAGIFYKYNVNLLVPGGISGNGWTNKPLGVIMLNLIKAMEFTEKGATNIPNGYWGASYGMGFYPSGSVAQAFNPLFDYNEQIPYTDKAVIAALINIYVSKYCDVVSRFTAAQYNFQTPAGTMASELYRTLLNWENWANVLKTRYPTMDLTAIIAKIKTTRNTIFPGQP